MAQLAPTPNSLCPFLLREKLTSSFSNGWHLAHFPCARYWVVRLFRYIRFTVLKGRGSVYSFLTYLGTDTRTLNKPRVTKPVSGRANSSDRSVWCSEVTCVTPMLRHTWCPLCMSVVGGLTHLPGALGLFTKHC